MARFPVTPRGRAACPVCGSTTCKPAPNIPYLETYPFMPGGIPVPTSHLPLAPCRVFHADTGILLAGVGQPIPDGVPLRYEDPAFAPADDPASPPPPPPPDEPEPITSKRGRVRTRQRPPSATRGGR